MKKILFAFFLCCFSITLFAQSQPDCGALDCPGRCGRFIDQNSDGFCDHGRLSAPATTNTQTTTSVEEKTEAPSSKEQNKPAAASTKNQNTTTKSAPTDKAVKMEEQPTEEVQPGISSNSKPETIEEEAVVEKPGKAKKPYNLILISAITLGVYALTFFLVKTDKMKKATHRKFWNIMLLITALVSCLLGFFLVIQINYNLKMVWLWTVKFYHVQFGISMTIIAVIHILWHVNYWKSYFKK